MYHFFSLHVAMGVSLHLILFHNPHAAWKNSKRICVHIRNSYCVWFFIAQKIPHQMKHQMCIILLIIWCVCTVHCYGADETKDPFKFDQRPLFLYSSEVQQYYFALCWNSSDALFHHWIKSSLKMPIITDISNAASIQHFACPIHELLLTFYWTKNTEKKHSFLPSFVGQCFWDAHIEMWAIPPKHFILMTFVCAFVRMRFPFRTHFNNKSMRVN